MSQPATEWPVAQPVSSLEQRVQQLEVALAALPDTQALEDRLVERVAQQLQSSVSTEASRLNSAPRPSVAPAATPVPPPPAEPAARQSVTSLASPPTVGPKLASLVWLLVDVCREALAIFRMFVDFHYTVAWSTRFITVVIVLAIFTSKWWDPLAHVPFVGEILDKLVALVLAFVMFKALSREARAYLEQDKSKK